jgi:hypothetical protein
MKCAHIASVVTNQVMGPHVPQAMFSFRRYSEAASSAPLAATHTIQQHKHIMAGSVPKTLELDLVLSGDGSHL